MTTKKSKSAAKSKKQASSKKAAAPTKKKSSAKIVDKRPVTKGSGKKKTSKILNKATDPKKDVVSALTDDDLEAAADEFLEIFEDTKAKGGLSSAKRPRLAGSDEDGEFDEELNGGTYKYDTEGSEEDSEESVEEVVEEEEDLDEVDEGLPPWWKDNPSGIEGADDDEDAPGDFDDSDEWSEGDDWSGAKRGSFDDDGDDDGRW